MWWLLFTAVDLYVGIIVLKVMEPTLPPEKLPRVRVVSRVLWWMIAALGVGFVALLWRRK
jgi:hypothetical protein